METILIKDTLSYNRFPTPNNEVNYENSLHLEEKKKKQKLESDVVNVVNHAIKRNFIFKTTDLDFFGGMWSSKLAGVRFNVDARSTAGTGKYVRISVGAKSGGFMNKSWIAKATVLYGRHGPVSLSAISLREKKNAVFVGFVHSRNNKYFVTGMWSIGRNCRNNLDVHQSVYSLPDVLRKYDA